MKTLFVLAVLAVLVLPEASLAVHVPNLAEIKELADQNILEAQLLEECEKQEGIESDLAAKLQKGDKEASGKVKCFLKCLLEKVDILKDGKLNDDMAIEKGLKVLGDEGSKAAVKKCHQVKTTDTCELGFQTFKCYFDLLKEKNAADEAKTKSSKKSGK